MYEGEKISRQTDLSDEAKKEVEEALKNLREKQSSDDKEVIQQAVTDASAVFAKHRKAEQSSDSPVAETGEQREEGESPGSDQEH